MTTIRVNSEIPLENDTPQVVNFAEGVDLMLRSDGDVVSIQFDDTKFPDMESMSKFLGVWFPSLRRAGPRSRRPRCGGCIRR